ncbi:trans-aconitate 2-methyltransferase [Isoptericola halotolerans]|uniref:Trans-aconitate 2-methyltransferase n=1 Tax=Isoptericola halotolerans TaxID=300560 RepID=A0ABX2A292_9MICO|nr:methyltransferase domain-containing protein [Isoptericola halotolerans]NOV96967.1 trans-aconitate 2-methyltransferase [Isoptericola halotolerans]
MADWTPTDYLRFADERSRPFTELVTRVPGDHTSIVDLGCGPGHLTAVLRSRWPGAAVIGLDTSPAMIDRARQADPQGTYAVGDVTDYASGSSRDDADLVISNATFQWVPGHRDLLPALADRARRVLAFSVPGNHDAPSHVLLREVAAREPYATAVGPVEVRATGDPAEYLEILARPGWTVDTWETTYTHLLPPTDGTHPVLRWIAATGARPTLAALAAYDAAHDTALQDAFEAEYSAALAEAYPLRPYGTALAFRRVFVVAARD